MIRKEKQTAYSFNLFIWAVSQAVLVICMGIKLNVKSLIELIKLRPGMFIGDLKLETLYYFISGFLFNNIITDRADKIDIIFKNEFHDWVRNWINKNKNLQFELEHNYFFYISQVCKNQEQCISMFFELADEFFNELHKK